MSHRHVKMPAIIKGSVRKVLAYVKKDLKEKTAQFLFVKITAMVMDLVLGTLAFAMKNSSEWTVLRRNV